MTKTDFNNRTNFINNIYQILHAVLTKKNLQLLNKNLPSEINEILAQNICCSLK